MSSKKNQSVQTRISEDFRKLRDSMSGELSMSRIGFTKGLAEYLNKNDDSLRSFMTTYKEEAKKKKMRNRKSSRADDRLFKVRF